jgi:DNA-binding MarR family transcriptional regulator
LSADRRLFFLMHRAHRAVVARVNTRAIAELGVSSSQLAALYYVAKHPGCSMTEVASLLDLNKSAVTGLVQRLEAAEVLRREPNPRDGRGHLLFVTKKGETIRAQSLPLVRKLTAEMTEGFGAADIETVFRFLNSLVERYGDVGEDEPEAKT